jgi:hypothetical protein
LKYFEKRDEEMKKVKIQTKAQAYYWRGSSFAGFRFFKFGIEVGNDRKDDNKK